MDGAYDGFVEAFGDLPDSGQLDEFHDDCPDGDLIIGYQITYSSGSGVLQIRFLCSLPQSSSDCGEFPTITPRSTAVPRKP